MGLADDSCKPGGYVDPNIPTGMPVMPDGSAGAAGQQPQGLDDLEARLNDLKKL